MKIRLGGVRPCFFISESAANMEVFSECSTRRRGAISVAYAASHV